MELENLKLPFKLKTILDNMCQQKKLYEEFSEIWLEIWQNNKGIYIRVTTKDFLVGSVILGRER